MVIQEINGINTKKGSSLVLTAKEIEVINKKLLGKKLNQQDSNYLSRYVRPKLREISSIDAKTLLNKLEYRQKAHSIENTIKTIIIKNLEDVISIILYGSAIQTNYKEYNDIDILIVTERKIGGLGDKAKKIKELKEKLNTQSITADIEIISRENLVKGYKNSPTLIYQLKDHKMIYGNIKIPKKIELYNIDLQMKLDWSYVDNKQDGREIYAALRNTVLVRLLLNKIIDNSKLKEALYDELGKNLIERLRNNQASETDRKIALRFLKDLLEKTEKEVGTERWGRIAL